jgi:glycosyltransferase involved in cell wall biosynthesis
MKIIVAHNRYQYSGGEDTVVAEEVRMLRERGHSVHLFSVDNDHISGSWAQAQAAVRSFYSRPIARQVSHLLESFRPDLLHVHNFFPTISPAIFFAAKRHHVPVVQTLHNYRLLCAAATFFRDGRPCEACSQSRSFLPGVTGRCYRGSRIGSAVVGASTFSHQAMGTWTQRIDRYIALTHFAANKFGEFRLPAEKIRVKPNFVPDRGVGDGQGGFALYAGRLSVEKGIETILAADQTHSLPLPVHIVGDGPLRPKVERACVRPGTRLRYLGPMSRDQVFEQMQSAAVLLVPSLWYEGLPMTIVEALSFGLPVIASRIGGLPEIVCDQDCGLLVDPGNPSALVESLVSFLANSSGILSMRQAARRRFVEQYSEQRNYELLMGIYSELVNAPLSSVP